jgi:beta-galactosidase
MALPSIVSPARLLPLLATALLTAPVFSKEQSLAGTWSFQIDPQDQGLKEKWQDQKLHDQIKLPGILQAQGFGNEVSIDTPWVLSLYDRSWFLRKEYQEFAKRKDVLVPFLCQPQRHYLGAAWYQREIEVDSRSDGKQFTLFLERCLWKTTLWVDGREIGSQDSLVAPHEYDLGELKAGKHQLTLRMDNRMQLPYRPDTHTVSDSLGSTWNGVAGKILLTDHDPIRMDEVQIFPDTSRNLLQVRVKLINQGKQSGDVELSAGPVKKTFKAEKGLSHAVIEVPMPKDIERWDEFNPKLHQITVSMKGAESADQRTVSFGIRDIRTRGTEFLVNGRPTYMRGNHDGGGFPITGSPPTDRESWLKILRVYKDWGMNHIRFHSWCPPEAAFEAADQLGVYIQAEAGMWNEFSPGSAITKMLDKETDRMIRAYGNHPSFVMIAASNEPKGRWKDVLPVWVQRGREMDSRRLWTTDTGWSLLEAPGPTPLLDFHATHRFGGLLMRGDNGWFGKDYAKSTQGIDKPVVTHEVGQWCAYPNLKVIEKFKGFLQPGNYEIFRKSLADHGLLERHDAFVNATGKLQLECYKEDVEANLRTPGLAGFQLLDIHDYMGQGTAIVGLLDPFYEEKGYASGADFRKFCSTTVPLARLSKRVFSNKETLRVPVEIAHYGKEPIKNAELQFQLVTASGKVIVHGTMSRPEIPIGKGTALGEIRTDLKTVTEATAAKLVVSGPGFLNDWNLWIYPDEPVKDKPTNVEIVRKWADAAPLLTQGKKVLLLTQPADLPWDSPPQDRVPIFWNRQMSPGWSRMLGTAIEHKHPLFAEFPTEEFGDWQWIDLIGKSRAINLDRLPKNLQPIVQPVDDWNRNWKLGMLFESKVGSGRLMVCGIDLEKNLDTRITARQFRKALLDYMAGGSFNPSITLTSAQLSGIFFDSRIMAKLGATGPKPLIDGDPNSFWTATEPSHPHVVEVSFPKAVPIHGVVIMPRQNHRDKEGDPREYTLEASRDGNEWHPVQKGELPSTWDPIPVSFPREDVQALRLTVTSGYGKDSTTSLAELAVMYDGPPLADGGDVEYRRVKSASEDVDEGNVPAN